MGEPLGCADGLIPEETSSSDQAERAHHRDLPTIEPEIAWAELVLLRQHVATLIWCRQRRQRVVRYDSVTGLVCELEWATERIHRLERVLARKGRAA
ncbi:MAG TPA: hypothetical protein VNJ02_13360 [Vicinamibacterales bacterium]|nr:hypothetical protein [Vicinamibacterales bacterium]